MDLKIEIEKVENGFILTWDENECIDDVESYKKCKEVIEENESNENETYTKLLERIADFFGKNYDRYSPTNLNIAWDKKGHKLE